MVPALLLSFAVVGAAPEGAPLHPPAVRPNPVLPDVAPFDRDGDRLDDELAARLPKTGPDTPLRVEFLFRRPVTEAQLEAFKKTGAELEWVFQSVSFGFIARVTPAQLPRTLTAVGREGLLLVKGGAPMRLDLDRATQNARARSAWAPGFGGSDAGFNGSPTTTIALIDTGVDPTHADLAGRVAYWRDFEGSATTPEDSQGHGSCVGSIAFGSGAGFEATKPTLKFTRSASFQGIGPGFVSGRAPMRFGNATVTVAMRAVFDGPEPTRVAISSSTEGLRSYSTLFSQTGASPLSASTTVVPMSDLVYSIGLAQSPDAGVTWGTTSTSVTPYPLALDGLPTMRGLAPGCRWGVARASDDVLGVEMALDDLMTQRQDAGIKVVNLSQSPDIDGGTLLPAKITTLVQGGVILVKTIGNTGRNVNVNVSTPSGLTALALTVGATNTANQLTSYTSIGAASPSAGQDLKPDLLAPGGSLIATDMTCVDSNTSDSRGGAVPDQVADDYAPEEGTSFAAPVVAGAAALVIEALESKGLVWDWGSSFHPRLVKALLLATATETNAAREEGPSPNPTLGRSASVKDRYEGYGLLNVDAAIEAATLDLTLPVSGTTSGQPFDRRAWARRVPLVAGTPFAVALEVPSTADFDLYLYGGGPTSVGNPMLRSAADRAGLGLSEQLSFTPTLSETGVLVVKRIAGHGTFQLVPPPVCGNGRKELGEACDDGNTTSGDCCSATCAAEANGNRCAVGSCFAGVCLEPLCGNGVADFPETCDDGNSNDGDCCSARCRLEPDGSTCTGGACGGGVCQPTKRSAAVPDSVATDKAAPACGCDAGGGALGLALLALLGLRRRSLRS